MRYYETATANILALADVRANNPCMSIPEGANLDEFGYIQIREVPAPVPGQYQSVTQGSYTLVDGKYELQFTLVDWDEAQIALEIARVAAARVPAQITMRQAKLALLYSDLLDDVDDAFATLLANAQAALAATTIGTSEYAAAFVARLRARAAFVEWETSTVVMRYKDLVIAMAAILGLTEDQLDDLFIYAATIPLL